MDGELRHHGPHPIHGFERTPPASPGEEGIALGDEDIESVQEAERPSAEDIEGKEGARRSERRTLKDALTSADLEPEAMLEMLAVYDREAIGSPEALEDLSFIAEDYGLDVKDLDPTEQKRLIVIFNGIKASNRDAARKNMAEVLERAMHERLADQAFRRIDGLERELSGSTDIATLRARLSETMRSLAAVAGQIRAAEGGLDDTFMDVVKRFNRAVAVKHRMRKDGVPEEVRAEVQNAFDDVFEEYKDFIEDDIITFEIQRVKRRKNGHSSVEEIVRRVYGLSAEEVEQRKRKNRARVAEEIKKMAEEPYVTAEMIERLHAVNNDGLMPRESSKLREEEDTAVFFGRAKRLGVLGPDVRATVDGILARANDLIDRQAVGKVSDLRYQVEAAGLHNDLLDVHPLVDRNGSTSLLFLELMMAHRGGYEPSVEREKSFYKKLARAVGYNPAAVAAVGYEMLKMRYVPGFYKGGLSEERKAAHEKISDLLQRVRKTGKL